MCAAGDKEGDQADDEARGRSQVVRNRVKSSDIVAPI